MILNITQSTPEVVLDNKENVVLKPAPPVSRHSTGRRRRSRTTTSQSPVFLAREAARAPRCRRTVSPRAGGHGVEDAGVSICGIAKPTKINRFIRLPRHLKRPAFRAIAPVVVGAIAPELEDVPVEHIRQVLQAMGPQMLCAAMNTVFHPPSDRLPRELDVTINGVSSDAPTHVFAIYSKTAAHVALYPAHALVLAAHCAHLPPLPCTNLVTPTAARTSLKLPVLSLCLPSPQSFPILLHYLYTKSKDHLIASLLPIQAEDSRSLEQLARELASTLTYPALLSHTAKVHGLWSNAAALGVFDEKLWETIDVVWAMMLDALVVSTGSTWKKGKGAM